MQLSILGAVSLVDPDGRRHPVRSRRQAQLLAVLAIHRGDVVPVERIADWLWGDALPDDPTASIQTLISRSRRLFDGVPAISAESGGYRLDLPEMSTDIECFEVAIASARRASAADAEKQTAEAVTLWRGTPFPELDQPPSLPERVRLETLHLEAVELRITALGELARHEEVVEIAEPFVLAHPTRERPVAALMSALYATGRQSDALERYSRLQRGLVEELGVDPSPELQELQLQILRQSVDASSATLDTAPTAVERPVHSKLTQQIRFCPTVDGVRLAYATSGDGPPIVRAANWMTHLDHDWDSSVWKHWLEWLSSDRRLVRYDERGCGLSDWNVGEFSFSDWITDLETIVDQLELERFPLLGISQGAAVAVAYAAKHPARVSRLVLVGGYAQGRSARAVDDASRAEADVQVELARVGWGTDDSAFRQVFTSQFMPGASRELWEEFNELQRRTTSPTNAAQFMKVFGGIDVSAAAADVRCPTLILHSRDELRVPLSSAIELAGLIPGSQLALLPSSNHLVLQSEEAWSLLRDQVDEFLAAD